MKSLRINRYLAADAAARSAAALGVLLLVYTAVDLVEAHALAGAPPGLSPIYLYRLPSAVFQLLPLAAALGGQLALARARRSGEWEAVQAAGVSPLALVWGFLSVPLAAVPVSVLIGALLAPAGIGRWQDGLEPGRASALQDREGSWRWFRKGGALFRRHGDSTTVIERAPGGEPTAWIDLPGRPDSGLRVWRIGTGPRVEAYRGDDGYRFDGDPLVEEAFGTPVAALPGASLPVPELVAAISRAAQSGLGTAPLEAELAQRAGTAAACLALPLFCLGIGIAARVRTAPGLVGIGLAAAIAYWIGLAGLWHGASAGICSPLWPGAAVPVLFGGVGLATILVGTRSA